MPHSSRWAWKSAYDTKSTRSAALAAHLRRAQAGRALPVPRTHRAARLASCASLMRSLSAPPARTYRHRRAAHGAAAGWGGEAERRTMSSSGPRAQAGRKCACRSSPSALPMNSRPFKAAACRAPFEGLALPARGPRPRRLRKALETHHGLLRGQRLTREGGEAHVLHPILRAAQGHCRAGARQGWRADSCKLNDKVSTLRSRSNCALDAATYSAMCPTTAWTSAAPVALGPG